MSFKTLKSKIEQLIVKAGKSDVLQTDIDNINQAFEDAGVEVGDTPSDEYGQLIDEVKEKSYFDRLQKKT